jgi:hypothetical protein
MAGGAFVDPFLTMPYLAFLRWFKVPCLPERRRRKAREARKRERATFLFWSRDRKEGEREAG